MQRGLVASVLWLGAVTLTSGAYAQTPAPPSSAAFESPAAPPAATQPAPAAPSPAETAPPAPSEPAPAPAAPDAATPPPPATPGSSTLTTPSPAALPLAGAPAVEADGSGEPSSGLGMIIPGWILLGAGLANGLAIPLCYTDVYRQVYGPEAQDICAGVYTAIAVGSLGVGIPLLIVGYKRRTTHKEWEQRHPTLGYLVRTQVALQNNSAIIVYRGTF